MVHVERFVVQKMAGFSSFLVSCQGQKRRKTDLDRVHTQHDYALYVPQDLDPASQKGEFTHISGKEMITMQ